VNQFVFTSGNSTNPKDVSQSLVALSLRRCSGLSTISSEICGHENGRTSMSRKQKIIQTTLLSIFSFGTLLPMADTANADHKSQSNRGAPKRSLQGTMCWVLDPVLGKETFVQLTFRRIGNDQSLLSGFAVRNDGSKPDRVLQMSGGAGRHWFTADGDVEVDRHLINLTYSFSKIGTDPSNAFVETGAALRGHYAFRLDPSDLNGFFEGNDIVLDWRPPLTGPSATFTASDSRTGYSSIANNYLGGIQCDGTVSGFDNCGSIIPLNNAGTVTLVGSNASQCAVANPQR